VSRLGNRLAVALVLCVALAVSGCKTTTKAKATGVTPASAAASGVVSAASSQPASARATEPPATVAASSPVDSATPAPASVTTNPTTSHASPTESASGTPSGTDAAGRTPCPLPPPQVFVHVSRVALSGGNVVLTYQTAARLCGGEDDGAYETTGTHDLQAKIDPAAKILMVPADVATSSAQQITAAELPAAMATPTFQYFGVTFDPTGTVVTMEQYFHP
jgi:hypothetical protein